MALESSGGFRSSSSPVKLRSTSLVVLSAGAALVALIGYLYMKSRQSKEKETTTTEKTKRKVSAAVVSKEEKEENSHKEVEEEETELVMSIVDTETVVVDKETKSSCCHKQEEANCSEIEIVEEVDFERISRDLVRIVLNCAVKKMVHENDELTHLMSNETTRTECSSSTSPSSSASSSSSKRCRNGTSGGTDEAELDEATTHELSMLETDSSSSSSSGDHTTSIIESPNASYHQETAAEASNGQQTQPTSSSSSTNLMKSSSTTSTASTASSAAVEAPIQQQPTVSLRQQTTTTTAVQSPSKQQYQPQNKKLLKTTNKPKPLNIHNKNTNDKPKSVAAQPTTTKSESQEEPQQQSKKQHHESQSTDSVHEDIIVYEFNFPRKFCGKLIGKNGIHVDHIRSKTRTQIAVRDDLEKHEQQIVCVSGRLEDVDQALDIISSRFPLKQYPTISFKPISKPIVYRRLSSNVNGGVESKRTLPFENSCVKKVLVAPNMFVDMKSAADEPINVHVSAVVNASHVFVQLPGNSTYESLQKLDECMLEVYGRNNNKNSSSNQDEEQVPVMSEPIEFGSICVAPTSYGWHRAMVTSYMSLQEARAQYADYAEECGLATVKFLDYGGYLTIPANQLRQLRSDFMLLPFQAVECYLDGIYVYQGAEEEGKKFLTEIIKGAQLKLSLCGYAEDGIPLIKLFLTNNIYQNLDLNSELVNYNYVFQIESESTSASEQPLTKQQQQQQHSIEA